MSDDKPVINLDDPHTRAVWDTVQRARAEVATWPAWKRGDAAAPTVNDLEALLKRALAERDEARAEVAIYREHMARHFPARGSVLGDFTVVEEAEAEAEGRP